MTRSPADLLRLRRTRHVIYLLVAAVVVLPYLFQLPMPFKPSSWAEKLYHRVDSLKIGSHVLLSFDYDPASSAELNPMAQALLRHCFAKGLVPIVMTHWVTGVSQVEKLLRDTAEEVQKQTGKPVESGKDYVFLGFKPGTSNLVLNMGENLKAAFDKDFYKQPTESMPALTGVQSLKNIDMAVDLAAGTPGVEMWIVYGSDRFHFPLGAGTTAVQAPQLYPFIKSNQLVGLLGGLRGAADYEQLLKKPADATRGMLAQSWTHTLLVILIIGANLRLLAGLFRRKRTRDA
jgi:hypothetical protein